MTRTYARELVKWNLDDLQALAALDPPQAQFFEKANRWVVKEDGRSYGIRPEQIIDSATVEFVRFIPQEDVEANVAVALGEDLVAQLLAATQEAREAEKPAVVVPARVVALNAELDDLLAHFT